jgi:hypothetical protein
MDEEGDIERKHGKKIPDGVVIALYRDEHGYVIIQEVITEEIRKHRKIEEECG